MPVQDWSVAYVRYRYFSINQEVLALRKMRRGLKLDKSLPGRVYVDEHPYPIESAEDLRDVAAILMSYAQMFERARSRRRDDGQLAFDFTYDAEYMPWDSLSLTEWIELAWEKLGRPPAGVRAEDLFACMIRLGYLPSSDDPLEVVKATLRAGMQFVRIGTTPRGYTLWGRRTPVPVENKVLVYQQIPSGFLIEDPRSRKDNRVVDYVVRALKERGQPLTSEELAAIVTLYGWHTKSGEPAVIIAATLRKYPEFEKRRGRWTFSELYYSTRPNEKRI